MARIAVTGHLGYVGSHFIPCLIADGHTVNGYDLADGVDIRRWGLAIQPCDVVVHLAALIDARASQRDPMAYLDTNVTGTINMLHAMRAVGCTRMVFASSAIVVDPASSPYAASKRMVENLLYTIHQDEAPFSFLAMRLFNVAGGRELHTPETHLIPRAIAAARTGKTLTIYGDGLATRDYIHVLDVVDALAKAVSAVMEYPLNGCMDIGTTVNTSALDIVHAVESVLDLPIKVVHADAVSEPRELLANPAHARVILNWRPTHAIHAIIGSAASAALDNRPAVLQSRPGAPTAP